jgi:hypothetical protein
VAGQATLEWGLDPLRRVVPRDQALHWVTPADIDSLSLEISSDSGTAVWHGTAPVGDSIAAVLAPGRYRYVARAYQSDRVAASANGPVEVEEFATELLPPSGTSIAALTETPSALAEVDSAGQRRGLATLAWPYLVLIALFCAEWGVRRFSGLR